MGMDMGMACTGAWVKGDNPFLLSTIRAFHY